MILEEVLKKASGDIISKDDFGKILITGMTDNSKEIKKGFLFVAVSGYNFDGHDYIEEAILLGAAVVIGEQEINNLEVPYIKVKNSRKVLGLIAKSFYRDPSSQKIMIGITGTNGKTTTSFMLKQILEENGISCTVIGTINNFVNGKTVDSLNTTPGTIELNSLLNRINDKVVIMEVSSHGLAQYRLEGIEFDFCIFTNLYQEHLDFHGTMEEYFRVKSLLFDKLKPDGIAVINMDNFWGEKLHESLQKKRVNSYLVGKSNHCDLSIIDFDAAIKPFIQLKEKGEHVRINIPLPGIHNLYNATVAYSVARRLPLKRKNILSTLSQFSGVPGRFEVYRNEDGPTCVIDYAHTADAIFYILQTARECGAKRIFHIFGFRGGRDTSKRAEMVKVSSELSEVSILTLDDLNTESINEMIKIMEKYHQEYSAEKGIVIPDRTLAIQFAFQTGIKDDWIIITGKGPENYRHPFTLPTTSDGETVLFLQNKRKRAIQ